jgi:hypothetical protein
MKHLRIGLFSAVLLTACGVDNVRTIPAAPNPAPPTSVSAAPTATTAQIPKAEPVADPIVDNDPGPDKPYRADETPPVSGVLPRYRETPDISADQVRRRLARMRELYGNIKVGDPCTINLKWDLHGSDPGITPTEWDVNGKCLVIGWVMNDTVAREPSADGTLQRSFLYNDHGRPIAALPLTHPLPPDFPFPKALRDAAGIA